MEEMVALQEVDLRLDVVKRRLGDLDEQLEEPSAHRALADELAAQDERLKEARLAHETLEAEVEALRTKIETEDGKLYSGETTDAKELLNLQEEVFSLRRNLKTQEDGLLARIDEEEHEKDATDFLRALTDGSRAAWEERRAGLQSEQEEVSAQADVIIADVEEARLHLAAGDLAVYDSHRKLRQVAVAAAVGGVCGSCRLGLPTTILNRARRAAEAVNCPACDCIVYIR